MRKIGGSIVIGVLVMLLAVPPGTFGQEAGQQVFKQEELDQLLRELSRNLVPVPVLRLIWKQWFPVSDNKAAPHERDRKRYDHVVPITPQADFRP